MTSVSCGTSTVFDCCLHQAKAYPALRGGRGKESLNCRPGAIRSRPRFLSLAHWGYHDFLVAWPIVVDWSAPRMPSTSQKSLSGIFRLAKSRFIDKPETDRLPRGEVASERADEALRRAMPRPLLQDSGSGSKSAFRVSLEDLGTSRVRE